MTRHILRNTALAAALLALAALLTVWFFPRSVLSVMAYPQAKDSFGVLAVGLDGRYLRGDIRSEHELVTALEQSACVRQVTSAPALSKGDICLFYGDMCAVISQNGSFLYAPSGGGDRYTIMSTDPELYPKIQSLLDFEDI